MEIKKRIKNRIVTKSYRQFCEFVDKRQFEVAAKLTVYLAIALFPGELFRELRYANMLFKFREKSKTS